MSEPPSDRVQNKVVVYTAIIGPTDSYAPPRCRGVDTVLFSDSLPNAALMPPDCSPTVVPVQPVFCDPQGARRTARRIKILGHPAVQYGGHKFGIWLDGSMDPGETDLTALAEEALLGADVAVLLHPERRDLYSEAQAVIDLHLDDPKVVYRQIERYRKDGFPNNAFPLPQTGVLFWRLGIPEVERFRAVWWREVAFGSVRDQVSFGYAAWRSEIRHINYMEGPHKRWGIRYRMHVTR